MADDVHFTVPLHKRCFGQRADRPWPPCGKPAAWQRLGPNTQIAAFFCDKHKQPGDAPIAADVRYRRVSITFDVLIAATSEIHGAATKEAVELISQLVEQAGGLVNLHAATSQTGRNTPPDKTGEGRGDGGRAE